MIYQIKQHDIIELLSEIFIAINIPWGLAIMFLFKNSDDPTQRVAIPPDRLVWAKLWMIATGGLWWFWWRYAATHCEHCGCVWSQELSRVAELDRYPEPHTYAQRVRILSGNILRKYHCALGPAADHDIIVKATTWQCVNCGHEHVQS